MSKPAQCVRIESDMEYHYFDNAATTRIASGALEAYNRTSLDCFANPSASHSEGHRSAALLSRCRQSAASALCAQERSIFFTSGATESINIVMSSLLCSKRPGRILISAIEHEAVAAWTGFLREKGWTVDTVPARGGFISPSDVYEMTDSQTRLVAVMAVNNVLGTIQDIRSIAEAVRARERESGRPILFFSDCVQALGKTGLRPGQLDIDAASFSGHKIHGPRGIGILYLKKGTIQVPSHAGGQESGIRGGTENLPAIAALAAAMEALDSADQQKVTVWNRLIRETCSECGIEVLSPDRDCTPYILSIATRLPSEVALRMLQDRGCLVSAGSACSNNARGKAEAVYRAAGFQKAAGNAIRISFSQDNTDEEVEELARALRSLVS